MAIVVVVRANVDSQTLEVQTENNREHHRLHHHSYLPNLRHRRTGSGVVNLMSERAFPQTGALFICPACTKRVEGLQ